MKSVYVAKLEEVRKLGSPAEQRAANAVALPGAAARLRAACQGFLAALGEARTAHLEEEEKNKVAGECQAALDWLAEKEALQQQAAKVNRPGLMMGARRLHSCCYIPYPGSSSWAQFDDPVLMAADVQKKEETVRRVCEPVLSKPPPPPPKAEEPAAEPAADTMETDAEIGPQPAEEQVAAESPDAVPEEAPMEA